MSTPSMTETEFILPMTSEERSFLMAMMDHELGETRIEAHHTDNAEFREYVLRRADLIRGLLEKLQRGPTG